MTADDWARFDALIAVLPDGCCQWLGSLTKDGYGRFRPRGHHRPLVAHRLAWERKNGPIPAKRDLDHFECERHDCVNPDHVRPVTRRENLLRGATIVAAQLARTHCPQGHPYDEQNTWRCKDGKRRCRTCNRLNQRKVRLRRRQALRLQQP